MSFVAAPMVPGVLHDAATRSAAAWADAHRGLSSMWDDAQQLGWDGLLVPEDLGGSGGTLHDLAAIAEAVGAQGLSLPVAERCGAAPLLLIEAARRHPAAAELVGQLAAQEAQVAWLQPATRGEGQFVVEALPATHYLAVRPGGDRLRVCHAARMPAPLRQWRAVDGLPVAAYDCDALPWSEMPELGPAGGEATACTLASLVGCIESVSAMGALVTHTTTHLNQRTQFGMALSSFQVLRHKVVDMYVKYEVGRGLVLDCMERAAHDLGAVTRDVQLAHLYLSDAGRHCAEAAVQLHGAIGMSEELPVSRVCKRLLATEFRHGDALRHAQQLTADLRGRALASA